MKKILFWIGGVMQVLTGCSMNSEPIIAGPIMVESYKIKDGQVDDEAIRNSLKSVWPTWLPMPER